MTLPEPKTTNTNEERSEGAEPLSSGDSLFNLLPQPSKSKPTVVEDDDEFLHKKPTSNAVKPKAKITVPSLSDVRRLLLIIFLICLHYMIIGFNMEIIFYSSSKMWKAAFQVLNPKFRMAYVSYLPKIYLNVTSITSIDIKYLFQKKSGLLSMLPQPRNAVSIATTTKSFVPHVLTQKPNTTAKKKPLPSPMKKAKSEATSAAQNYSDHSDSDDEVQNDFFSIHKTEETPIADMPLDIDLNLNTVPKMPAQTQKEPRTLQSYFKQEGPDTKEDVASNVEAGGDNPGHYGNSDSSNSGFANGYEAETSNSSEPVLDDEAVSNISMF